MTRQQTPPARAVDPVLADEALDRLIHLHSGNATEADWTAWHDWRAADPRRAAAAQEAEALWQGLGAAGPAWVQGRRRARMTRRALILGGVSALGGAGLYQAGLVGPHLLADHRTAVARRQEIRLRDGTPVTLDARSALSETPRGATPGLHLHRGRIAIAPGAAPPVLRVQAGPVTIHSPGAGLDVNLDHDRVTVTALSGALEVRTPGPRLTLPAQSRMRLGPDGQPIETRVVDVAAETAWRRGKLIFDARPLSELATELERYRGGRILIPEARIAAMEVTGLFDLDDPDGMLDSMARSLPVRIRRLPLLAIIHAA